MYSARASPVIGLAVGEGEIGSNGGTNKPSEYSRSRGNRLRYQTMTMMMMMKMKMMLVVLVALLQFVADGNHHCCRWIRL